MRSNDPLWIILGGLSAIITIFSFTTGWPSWQATRAHIFAPQPIAMSVSSPLPRPSEAPANPAPAQAIIPVEPARRPWKEPHFYIHIAGESQRRSAEGLKRILVKRGYVVADVQNVSGSNGIPDVSSEVRFFTPTDSAEAHRLASELSSFFAPTGVYADSPPDMPYVSHSRQYEIWFSHSFR